MSNKTPEKTPVDPTQTGERPPSPIWQSILNTPLFSPESLNEVGQQQLKDLIMLAQNGEWRAISEQFFPMLPEKVLKNAKKITLTACRTALKAEYSQLLEETNAMLTDTEDTESAARGRGRMEQIEDELGAIYRELYPDVDPKEHMKLLAELNPESAQAIEFFVKNGDWENLDPDKIPQIKHLTPKVLTRLKLTALTVDRVGWEELLHIGDIEDQTLGFNLDNIGSHKPPHVVLAEKNIALIDTEIERISQNALSSDTPR